jgi:hypothetical protein
MYTIDHAEKALRQCGQVEKTLQQYNVTVLEELCAKNGTEVDKGSNSNPRNRTSKHYRM